MSDEREKCPECSFVFYKSFFDSMQGMDDHSRLALYDAIARKGIFGVDSPGLSPEVRRLFILMVPLIEANRKKRADGRKGGRPAGTKTIGYRKQKTAGYKNRKPYEYEYENENENENEDEEEKKGADKPHKFTPPSLNDVESYCRERQNNVDAARFVDYYTANGWRIGKTTMKDWRAAVRTWERNEPKQAQPANRYDQIKKLMEETPDD